VPAFQHAGQLVIACQQIYDSYGVRVVDVVSVAQNGTGAVQRVQGVEQVVTGRYLIETTMLRLAVKPVSEVVAKVNKFGVGNIEMTSAAV